MNRKRINSKLKEKNVKLKEKNKKIIKKKNQNYTIWNNVNEDEASKFLSEVSENKQ